MNPCHALYMTESLRLNTLLPLPTTKIPRRRDPGGFPFPSLYVRMSPPQTRLYPQRDGEGSIIPKQVGLNA